MRGKERLPEFFLPLGGITPAYAGKRHLQLQRGGKHRDHPRVCGEKGIPAFVLGVGEGSPPRMRGKDFGIASVAAITGITPAYAGKSAYR